VRYECLKITRCSEDNIRRGKQAAHGIMPHGTLLNKMKGQFEISRKKVL
jgi:hypothetical protein